MNISLKRTGIILIIALLGAPLVFAENPAAQTEPEAATGSETQTDVITPSGEQLDQVANITVEVQKVQEKHLPELSEAESREEVQQIQQKMQKEAFLLIEEEGMTVNEYKEVLQAVQADNELEQKLVAMIKTKVKAEE